MPQQDVTEQCLIGKKVHHILNTQRLDLMHSHGSAVKGLTLYLHFSSVATRTIELGVFFSVADINVEVNIVTETDDISEDYVFSDDKLLIPSEFQLHLYISKTTEACEVTGALLTRGA